MVDATPYCPTCGEGPFSTPQARAGHEQRHVTERLHALEAKTREADSTEALRGYGAQRAPEPALAPQPRGSAAPDGGPDAPKLGDGLLARAFGAKVTLVDGPTLSDEESRLVVDFKAGRISAFDLAQRLDALRIRANAEAAKA